MPVLFFRSHFGGGPSTTNPSESKAQSRKELIAELIAKTKQQRYDKQMQRDEQLDLTDKLDEQWKQLMAEGGLSDVIVAKQVRRRWTIFLSHSDKIYSLCEEVARTDALLSH